MSDLITQARNFLTAHLTANGTTTVTEAHAVQAMVGFAKTNASPTVEHAPVTETPEYKELEAKLAATNEQHSKDIKQRDYNWSELQKAKAQITELEEKLANATKPAEEK